MMSQTPQTEQHQAIPPVVHLETTAQDYVDYAEALLDRAQVSSDPQWTDTLHRMAGQMMEIAIYLGARVH